MPNDTQPTGAKSNGGQQWQYIQLPDGQYGQFPTTASDEQIRSVVEKNYPETATYHPSAQEQAEHPIATAMAQEGLTDLKEAQARAAFTGQHPYLSTMADIASTGAPGLAEAPWSALPGMAGKVALRGAAAAGGLYTGGKIGGGIGGEAQELTGIPGLRTAGTVVGGALGGLAGGLGLSKISMPETFNWRGFQIPIPEWVRSAGAPPPPEPPEPTMEEIAAQRTQQKLAQRASDVAAGFRQPPMQQPLTGPLPRAAAAYQSGQAAASEEGIAGSIAKPSGRLVLTPSEARTQEQMMNLARQRASEHGMQYAAGMRPAGGGRVPLTPTGTVEHPWPDPREIIRFTEEEGALGGIPGRQPGAQGATPRIEPQPPAPAAQPAPRAAVDPVLEKFTRGEDLSLEEQLDLSNRLTQQFGAEQARQMMALYTRNLKYMGGAKSK